MDGSSSVSVEEFQTELNFSLLMSSKVYVDPDKVQLGLSVFAYEDMTYQSFANNISLKDFSHAVLPATKLTPAGKICSLD